MFGISLGELAIVLLVALAVIRPKDLTSVAKNYKLFIKNFSNIKSQITDSVSEIHNQIIDVGSSDDEPQETSELDDHHYILDNKGKLQKAYKLDNPKPRKVKSN